MMCVLSHLSHVRLFVTLGTVVCQAPLSMGFSRQEYWSEFPCSPSGTLPDPGIKSASFMFPPLASGFLFCFVLFLSYLGSPYQWWGVGLEKNGKRCTCKQMGQQTKKNSLMEETQKRCCMSSLEVEFWRRLEGGGEENREGKRPLGLVHLLTSSSYSKIPWALTNQRKTVSWKSSPGGMLILR